MSKRAEELSLKAYPISPSCLSESNGDGDRNYPRRLAFIEGYEQAEKNLGWISVNDRLPEEPGWYITCFEDNGVAQGIGISFYVSDTQSWLDDEDIKYEVAIDYWMEIPKLKK